MTQFISVFAIVSLFALSAFSKPPIIKAEPYGICPMGYEPSMPNGNPEDTWCVMPNDWMSDRNAAVFNWNYPIKKKAYDSYRPTTEDNTCDDDYLGNYRGAASIIWCTEIHPDLKEYRPLDSETCLEGFEEKTRGLKDIRWCLR